jgi:hypothetical protein
VTERLEMEKDKTLYVVSGFMRTGTSMMMRALENGGMDACYRQSRDVMKNRHADEFYDPNIGGLYELAKRDYQMLGFPNRYEGRLIKALNQSIPRMAVMTNGIRVVFMRRHREEIRQSYAAFFGTQLQSMAHLDTIMENTVKKIENRKDVLSLDVFWYRDVIEHPLSHFKILRSHGWPIDIQKAISVIDPQYYRFRIENLTEGVM